MPFCPCCCPNSPEEMTASDPDGNGGLIVFEGKFCICEDYTQMVIEVPPLEDWVVDGQPLADCSGTGATLVVDFVNEAQGGPGGWRVNPITCAFFLRRLQGPTGPVSCVMFGPGVSGFLLNEFGGDGGQFFTGAEGQGTGVESLPGESCASFSDRYDRRILHQRTINGPPCLSSFGGGWSLQ